MLCLLIGVIPLKIGSAPQNSEFRPEPFTNRTRPALLFEFERGVKQKKLTFLWGFLWTSLTFSLALLCQI